MNWRHKAATQMLLSHVPGGGRVNYLLGRYVTHHIPASDATFRRDLEFARWYLEAFRKYGAAAIDDASFYEFGGGWDLIVPLSFYVMGANHQLVTDIRPLLRPWMVRLTALKLKNLAISDGLRPLVGLDGEFSLPELCDLLQERFGICYQAPMSACATGLGAESVDYITSTKTLCHMPEGEIARAMRECYRLLRPGGNAAFVIDYRDQYSYSDRNISVYNFLQFSDEEWGRYNPPLHYQNRLRHCDYVRQFREAGFEIAEEICVAPKQAEIAALSSIRVSSRFANYGLEDLGAVRGDFVLRKKA